MSNLKSNLGTTAHTHSSAVMLATWRPTIINLLSRYEYKYNKDIISDVSKRKVTISHKSLHESVSQQDTDEAIPTSNIDRTKKSTKFKTSPPEQMEEPADVSDSITHYNLTGLNLPPSQQESTHSLHSSRQSKNVKRSSNKIVADKQDACFTQDKISNRQPRPRSRWKSKIKSLGYFGKKHNCVCQDIEEPGSTADEISSQQSCFQKNENKRSKIPKKTSRQKKCDYVDTDNADNITGEISGQLSKIPEDTSSEENLKDAGIMTDEKSSRKLKTPKDSAIEDDRESQSQVITDQTETQRPCSLATHMSKKESNRKYQEKTKSFSVKKNCVCQETPKDSAGNHTCECQKCQENQNGSGSKGFCVCEDIDQMSKKCGKMTKFINNVKKRKTSKTKWEKDEKVRCEYLGENMKDEKIICECLGENMKDEKVRCECLRENMKDEKVICECLGENMEDEKVKCKCLIEKVEEEKVTCMCFKKILMTIEKLSKKKQKIEETSLKLQSEHEVQTIPKRSKDDPCEQSCGWTDIEKLMKLRSELAECTSGFKACKKRKRRIEKPPPEIELDFEDAIKYYVGKNLEQFQDLIQPLESYQEKYKSKKEKNLAITDIQNDNFKGSVENVKIPLKEPCQCPYGQTPPYETITFTPEACEKQAKLYPKGMKLCLGAKGVAPMSPGVVGMTGRGDVVERSGRDGFPQIVSQNVIIQTPDPYITKIADQELDAEKAGRDRVVQTTAHDVTQTPGPFIIDIADQESDTEKVTHDRVVQTTGDSDASASSGTDGVTDTSGRHHVVQKERNGAATW